MVTTNVSEKSTEIRKLNEDRNLFELENHIPGSYLPPISTDDIPTGQYVQGNYSGPGVVRFSSRKPICEMNNRYLVYFCTQANTTMTYSLLVYDHTSKVGVCSFKLNSIFHRYLKGYIQLNDFFMVLPKESLTLEITGSGCFERKSYGCLEPKYIKEVDWPSIKLQGMYASVQLKESQGVLIWKYGSSEPIFLPKKFKHEVVKLFAGRLLTKYNGKVIELYDLYPWGPGILAPSRVIQLPATATVKRSNVLSESFYIQGQRGILLKGDKFKLCYVNVDNDFA